jgi:hypothetical protein
MIMVPATADQNMLQAAPMMISAATNSHADAVQK